jgi:hypothetical protein
MINNPKIDEKIFSVIKNLDISEGIRINYNNLSTIPENAFKGLAKEIHLEYNFIERIGSNAFTLLPNLETLDMNNNLIDTIEKFGLNFAPNKMNKTISLFKNRLSSKSFVVDSLPRMQNDSIVINLEENLIENLPEFVFKPFLEGENHVIYFDRNGFKCDCSLKWILGEPQSDHVYDIYCSDKKKSVFDLINEEFGCPTIPPTKMSTTTKHPKLTEGPETTENNKTTEEPKLTEKSTSSEKPTTDSTTIPP